MAPESPRARHRGRTAQGFRACGRPCECLQGSRRRLRLLQSTVRHPEKQGDIERANRGQGTLQLLYGLHGLLGPLVDEVDDPLIKARRIAYVMQLRALRGEVGCCTRKMLT